jgi:uncharacterized protein (TIGR02145 family)
MSKVLMLFLMILLMGTVSFTSAEWERVGTIDKWGDASGHLYRQCVTSEGRGSFHIETDEWKLCVEYSEARGRIWIIISSIEGRMRSNIWREWYEEGTKSQMAPTIARVERRVTLSLRDADGKVQEFSGTTVPQNSSAQRLSTTFDDRRLIETLGKDGNFRILIEGDNWNVRADVRGNLPLESNRERLEQKRVREEQARRGGTFTDSRDGKKYRTVRMGNRTWMAENLNFQTGNSWCYYDKESDCQTYGRLYDWNTAVVACPAGWRLPTRDDWRNLVEVAGGVEAGAKLKSRSPDWNGTDDFGFSALPGGHRNHPYGSFNFAGSYGFWWSATEGGSDTARGQFMSSLHERVDESNHHKGFGSSVLCLQD